MQLLPRAKRPGTRETKTQMLAICESGNRWAKDRTRKKCENGDPGSLKLDFGRHFNGLY